MALAYLTGGCADTRYLWKPTVTERALERRLAGEKKAGDRTEHERRMVAAYSVTDRDIVDFSNDVRNALRSRMNWSRFARLFSGTFQVLSAAAAAALGATTGNLEAITALAAASAVTPEVQEIFDARASAEAYRQGVELVDRAEARYFNRVVQEKGEVATNRRLTKSGARYYREVIASLKLVEKAMIAQLPTIEELEKATGRFADDIDEGRALDVQPRELQLSASGPAGLLVVLQDEDIVGAGSHDTAIATSAINPTSVGGNPPHRTINVAAQGPGETEISAVGKSGRRRDVKVTVGEAKLDVDLIAAGSLAVKGQAAYSLRIRNDGPFPAPPPVAGASPLQATIVLLGAGQLSAAPMQGHWSCTSPPPATRIDCTRSGAMNLGDAETLDLTVTPTAPGQLIVEASVRNPTYRGKEGLRTDRVVARVP